MTPAPPASSDSPRVNPVEVDARGLRCPLPVIRLAQAARGAPAGTWIVVLANDPAARYDIPAWCRMRDHKLCEMTEVPDGQDVSSRPTRTEPTRAIGPSAMGDHPAYLRFLVLIRDQRSKPRGAAS